MKKILLLAAACIVCSLGSLPAADQPIVLKVIADACNLREGAGKNWKALSVLKYGDRVSYLLNSGMSEEISGSTAPWIKVRTADGKTGFVFGALLSFVSSPDGMAPYVEYSATPLAFSKKEDLERTEPERRYRYVRHWFSPKEMELLSSKGFMVEKGNVMQYVGVDDMVDRYLPFSSIYKTEPFIQVDGDSLPSYRELPLYISSDYMLHCFHLIFDRMLESIEQEKLAGALKELTAKEYNALYAAYSGETDPDMRAARFAALCFVAVPRTLLEREYDERTGQEQVSDGLSFLTDSDVRRAVLAECGHIDAASGPSVNAVTGGKTDYSQFTVRGHYTHTQVLANYFKAMIWFGRVYFPLDERPVEGAILADTFRDAGVMKAWSSVNAVIERLVGRSDDLGPREYLAAADKVFGEKLVRRPDADALKRYRAEVSRLSKSAIVSSPLRNASGDFESEKTLDGFRFMGQRFILDSRIFTLLTSPRVGDDAHPRNIPRGLDIFAAYGAEYAETLLADDISSTPNFKKNFRRAKDELESREMRNPTVYESWIDLLGYYASSKDKVRQRFTASPEWKVRKLNASHGSWAELRHDTILYAKPSCAEMGGPGGDPVWVAGVPSVPRGYVEPDPDFWQKLSDVVTLLKDSCAKENLLSDGSRRRTDSFREITKRLAAIAKKEIGGKALTDDEAIYLGDLNRELSWIVIPERLQAETMSTEEKQMALVADVHTDALSGQILHVAVGAPRKITIFVNDASGARVCEGYAFSYYEFTASLRMTDHEWKQQVYGEGAPRSIGDKEPAWTRVLPYTD